MNKDQLHFTSSVKQTYYSKDFEVCEYVFYNNIYDGYSSRLFSLEWTRRLDVEEQRYWGSYKIKVETGNLETLNWVNAFMNRIAGWLKKLEIWYETPENILQCLYKMKVVEATHDVRLGHHVALNEIPDLKLKEFRDSYEYIRNRTGMDLRYPVASVLAYTAQEAGKLLIAEIANNKYAKEGYLEKFVEYGMPVYTPEDQIKPDVRSTLDKIQ